MFNNHIVVCVFAESHGPLVGLRTFCIPLRASNLLRKEMKKIVFVGDGDYLRREWEQLCNFPDINVLPVRHKSISYPGQSFCVNVSKLN